ncbi:EEP domain-containing protein [Thiomicrorhabdus immobilis]|uniref:EEP domain-containing protein n=1 Tax=Thiomicrorhabdus immobilis TaxID=2791037 RepID=A0ABN6D2M5_9GAMM|nr:endonuclease/exonuclease/phosphatase family protein [Thiomicrorhabdus immobilis]BCN94234.1 EEP domain-containing protein [Thiomicrorhabdus immobilis]
MLKPKTTPITETNGHSTYQQALPEFFTLLTWNLQKIDFSHFIHRPIEELLPITQVDLLSLQEAAIQPQQNRFFNLPFFMAPNIETRNRFFGVLTASQFKQSAHQQCLTNNRELGWMTHKTALITHHLLADGQTLIHVNIHAINFVPHHLFKTELRSLWSHIAHTKGPLIVSGDFNTWNKARLTTLLSATEQLNLSMVSYPDNSAVKTLNRQPLDYIFYRDLQLQDSKAMAVPEISDHNPLMASFSLP